MRKNEISQILLYCYYFSVIFYSLSKTEIKEVYWVKSGKNGEGITKSEPAGNISYSLRSYSLTNDVIKVKPGTYDTSVEQFSLLLHSSNLTLLSTQGPSRTILNASQAVCIQARVHDISIQGFTICQGHIGISALNANVLRCYYQRLYILSEFNCYFCSRSRETKSYSQ